MKLTIIRKDEMIIRKEEYINMLKEISELKEKASPFYKYSINEIREYCGFPPIKKKNKENRIWK